MNSFSKILALLLMVCLGASRLHGQNSQDGLTPEEAARLQQSQQQGVRISNAPNTIESTGGLSQDVLTPDETARQPQEGVRRSNTPGTIESTSDPARRAVRPPIQAAAASDENEFQDFVTQSVGTKLPIFGQSLFANVPSTFAPVDRIPVSSDYVVGPGDELLIRAWGSIDIDYRAVVDRNGNVYVPRVGSVGVAGLQYQQLQGYLKSAVGKYFRNFDLSVNMGQLRSIQIFVVGQARHPGSYTVSSLSTLVNAVFASGGPLSKGSMRHIQLKRNNQTVTDFDLYDLILRGDKSKDSTLMPGDVIYIAPVGPLVALFGSVNAPAIYELKESTTLGDAISAAGGLTTTAEGQKAVLERIDERKQRSVAEVNLDPTGLSQPLKDGDIVRLIPISPRFENAVTIRGNVALPGRYPWHPGMRIKDLIPSKEFLVVRSFYENQNELVKAPIKVAPETTDKDASQRVNESRLSGEIKRNAPEINWDYAVVERLNLDDLSSQLIPFNLGKAILEGDTSNNIELQPGDVVTIFSQEDMKVPRDKQSKFVRLEGEVKAAGIYSLGPHETLRQLIERVGGLTPNAYLFGSELTRESTRIEQQKRLDQFILEMQRSIERNAITSSNRAPIAEEATALKAAQESQRQVLDSLRQTKASGRIVLAMKPNSTSLENFPDLVLEDGDHFVVPARPATVEVVGTVYNPGAFIHHPDKRVRDYLREAGGPTRDADKSQIYVIRADGSVLGNRGYSALTGGIGGLKMMPGDALVVPENLNKGSVMRNVKDIAYLAGQFGLAAAAINVLRPNRSTAVTTSTK